MIRGRSTRAVLRMPREMIHGAGALESLPGVVESMGKRPFILVDEVLLTNPDVARALDSVMASGRTISVSTDIEPELPRGCIDRAVLQARQHEPDVLVGIGGGSTIDLVKVVSVLIDQDSDTTLSDFYGENHVPSGRLPIIAVPTTAGTGSEVTPVAVISDPDRELKVGVSSPYLVPDVAIVDPRLTYTCPATISAHSGIDALCHGVESMTSRVREVSYDYPLPVFTGVDDVVATNAEVAIELIAGNLGRVVVDGSDESARQAMSLGSTLAGMAFATGGTHLGHAIQYPVGALTKTPHGLGVGLLLPYVMEVCLPTARPALHRVAQAIRAGVNADPQGYGMQASTGGDVEIAWAIGSIVELRRRIGIPNTLAEIGVRHTDLARIVELSLTVRRLVDNAPGEHPDDMVEEVVRRSFLGESDIF